MDNIDFRQVDYPRAPEGPKELKAKKTELACLTTLQQILTSKSKKSAKIDTCKAIARKIEDPDLQTTCNKIIKEYDKATKKTVTNVKERIKALDAEIQAFGRHEDEDELPELDHNVEVAEPQQGVKRALAEKEQAPVEKPAMPEESLTRRFVKAVRTRPALQTALIATGLTAWKFTALTLQPTTAHAVGQLGGILVKAGIIDGVGNGAIKLAGAVWKAVSTAAEPKKLRLDE